MRVKRERNPLHKRYFESLHVHTHTAFCFVQIQTEDPSTICGCIYMTVIKVKLGDNIYGNGLIILML